MRETPLSTCERNFVAQTVKSNQRLDGRKNNEFRPVKISFGSDWGSVLVSMGQTKVLAQISCEIGVPKATRPQEGLLFINVELGPMAAPHFEAGRNSDLGVRINRTLERTFKDSRCVDLESLCLTAHERVWILRADLNVLNHEGNIIDCCSIAALCAFAHFRRPDVTIDADEIKIHKASEKELIPVGVRHYPVCVTYCTFADGKIAIADPTDIEERTSESQLIYGLNSYNELCCLNLGGNTLMDSNLLLQCAKRAAQRVKHVVDQIKDALQKDAEARAAGQIVNFSECMHAQERLAFAEERIALKLRNFSLKCLYENQDQQMIEAIDEALDEAKADEPKDSGDAEGDEGAVKTEKVIPLGTQTCILNPGNSNIKWVPDGGDTDGTSVDNLDSHNETDECEVGNEILTEEVGNALREARYNQPVRKEKRRKPLLFSQPNAQGAAVISDSEEEETVIL